MSGTDREPPELNHDFDGIRELDHPVPSWFNLLFWGTIAWSVVYALHYHWGPGKTGADRWQADMVELNEIRARTATGPLPEEQMRALSVNPERIAAGKAVYAKANCATCHGVEATGTVGPNLRDRYWIHGSTMREIRDVIASGRANGQMPGHQNLLGGDDLTNLTIYLVSLNRAGPVAGKAIDPAREHDTPITY